MANSKSFSQFLRMSVNLAQHRVIVGIFNNQKISKSLTFKMFSIWKWSNNLFKYVSIFSSLLLYICLCSLFLSRESVLKITIKFCILIFLLFSISQIVFECLCSLLVMLSGDVEVSPGSKKKDRDCLSICYWNLNSISAYGYSKLFLLNLYNLLHKFDIICLSKTYLHSNTLLEDDNRKISGYSFVRSDHYGGVCLYCKNNLPLKVINIGYLN